MDVTKNNFQKLLPFIEKQIEGADFISIDGEFTGLCDGRQINAFDTPAEYYETLRTGSMDFLLIQFGLCAFKWDETSKVFKHSGYNFYLFPGTAKEKQEKMFLCQSSSIKFLASQKFDFNKLFHDGISYLSTSEEMHLKEKIEENHSQEKEVQLTKSQTQVSTEDHIPVPEEDKPQISKLCEEVQQFLDNQSEESLELNVTNSFVRKLLYQEFETKFSNNKLDVRTITNDNNKRVLQVRKVDGEQYKTFLEKKHSRDWENFEQAVGFSRVVRKISESGKLLVGHCLLLDLLHVLHQFFSPLPKDYQSFKDFTKCTFPSILDTMYLASIPQIKDKVASLNLENLFNSLSSDPFQIPNYSPEDSEHCKGYSLTDDKYHEAGYDAFMTGLCFIAMADYLAKQNNSSLEKNILNYESRLIAPYTNKIFLFKTFYQDSPFIHLGGTEVIPSRGHVFHITFPTKWKRSDIVELFSCFGGVVISFIDDNSAFVALRKRNLASKVLKVLKRKNTPYTITTYNEYKMKKTTTNPYKYTKSNQGVQQTVPAEDPLYSLINRTDAGSGEDVGEPVSRDSVSSLTVSDPTVPRRRTLTSSSEENGHVSKRHRTFSGVFEVEETPLLPPAKEGARKDEKTKKRVFNENDDWE